MTEAEVYQWRDGPPGVRYPGEIHPNRTCSNLNNAAHRKGMSPAKGTKHHHLRVSALHRKETKTTISVTSLIQINKTLDHTD